MGGDGGDACGKDVDQQMITEQTANEKSMSEQNSEDGIAKEYDVNLMFSGTITVTAKSEDDAMNQVWGIAYGFMCTGRGFPDWDTDNIFVELLETDE